MPRPKVRGIETKAVRTAGEVLTAIHTEHFELYLLDGWLPDLDGFELCRQMRDFDSQTPILFFSGAGCDADKKMGYQAGANDYVVKPDVPHLVGSITQFMLTPRTPRPSSYSLRGSVLLHHGHLIHSLPIRKSRTTALKAPKSENK